MSDELVGQRECFLRGHKAGKNEGYQKALDDMQLEIHKVPTQYDSVSVKLLDGLIDKLKVKK